MQESQDIVFGRLQLKCAKLWGSAFDHARVARLVQAQHRGDTQLADEIRMICDFRSRSVSNEASGLSLRDNVNCCNRFQSAVSPHWAALQWKWAQHP